MAKVEQSAKRLQITKANGAMVLTVSVAVFVAISSLVVSQALLSKRSYQARVITEKTKARDNLKKNLDATEKLVTAYQQFVAESPNILESKTVGTGDNEGDNAKIILDALPSKYDYPALATSLEKILVKNNYKIFSITGTDDEINQQSNTNSPNPQPVPMTVEAAAGGTYETMPALLQFFERSIRPFQVTSLVLTATQDGLKAVVSANTFYQPAKSLKIETKEVK